MWYDNPQEKGARSLQLLIDQKLLAGALNTLGRIVPRRPITPTLSAALLSTQDGQVRLEATDLQSYAQVSLGATVHSDGRTAVDARFFQRVVATLDDEEVALSLSDSGRSLRITAGHAAFRLRTLDAKDFPAQEIPSDAHLEIDARLLVDLIARTTFCAVDSDDVSPFAGVLIAGRDEWLAMAATDGYQLAYYQLPATAHAPVPGDTSQWEAVVPTGGLTALSRALSSLGDGMATLAWHERSLWCRCGPIAWQLRRLDLQYPDLARFIGPLAGTRVEVERDRLLDAVKKVSSISDEGRILGVRSEGRRLYLFASHREVGEAQTILPLNEELPRREVWVDAQRLARAVSAQPDDHVAVYLSEPLAPIVVVPAASDPPYRSVLTPLRIYNPDMDDSELEASEFEEAH